MPDKIMRFYTYGLSNLVCSDCMKKDIAKTKSGEYTEDEAVTENMVEFVGTHGQCDNCLEQCECYPD